MTQNYHTWRDTAGIFNGRHYNRNISFRQTESVENKNKLQRWKYITNEGKSLKVLLSVIEKSQMPLAEREKK